MRFYKRASVAAMACLSGSLTSSFGPTNLFGVEEFESHLSSAFNGVWRSNGNTYLAGETRSFGFGGLEGFFFTNSDSGIVNATTFGGTDLDTITDITVDGLGNIIICGYTKSLSINAIITYDGFIAKFDINHNLLWQKSTNYSKGSDYIYAVKCMSDNTIIAVGHTGSYNSGEMFIAKFGDSGNIVWHYNFGNTAGFESGYDLVIDSSNNIYVVGETTSGGISYGDYDVFVAKFTTTGAISWQRGIGGTGVEHANGIAIDIYGNVFIGVASTSYNASYTNVVLVKLNSSGVLQSRTGVYCNSVGNHMMDVVSVNVVSNDTTYDLYMVCVENTFNVNDGYRRSCLLFKFNNTGNLLWSRRLSHTLLNSDGLKIQSAVNEGSTLYLAGQISTVNRVQPDKSNTNPVLITLPLNDTEPGTQGTIIYAEATNYVPYATVPGINVKNISLSRNTGVSSIANGFLSDRSLAVDNIAISGKSIRLVNDRYNGANSELESSCFVEYNGKLFVSGNNEGSTTLAVLDAHTLNMDTFQAISHGAHLPTYGIAASDFGVATFCMYPSGNQTEIRKISPSIGSIDLGWLLKHSAGSLTPVITSAVSSSGVLVISFVCQDTGNSEYYSSYMMLLAESDFSVLGSMRLRANSTHHFYLGDCKPNLIESNSYVLAGYSSNLGKGIISLANNSNDNTLSSIKTIMAKDPDYATAFAKCCIDQNTGNIVVSGYVTSDSSNKDFIVGAFTSELQPLWARSYSTRSDETGSSLTIANGIIYAASINHLACYSLTTGELLGIYGVSQCTDLLIYDNSLYTYEYQAVCKYDLVNGLPVRQNIPFNYTTRTLDLIVEEYILNQTTVVSSQVIDMALTAITPSTTMDKSSNLITQFDITNGFVRNKK